MPHSHQLANLNIVITLRSDGDFSFDEKIQKFIPSQNPFWINQMICEHKSKIVNSDYSTDRLVADAIIHSKNQKINLCLKVADCFPVVLTQEGTNNFSLIHLGWRSLYLNLLPAAISQFLKTTSSTASDLKVWIGPGLEKSHNFSQNPPTQSENTSWKDFISRTKTGYFTDLKGFLIEQLISSGVSKSNLIDSGLYTYSNPDFFSHRRSKEQNDQDGRMLILVHN